MKLTGRNGILRIYESTAVPHGLSPYDSIVPDVVKFDGSSTWANITTDVQADDTNIASAFIGDDNDQVYLGSTIRFAKIKFLKGGGTNYAVGSGAIIAKYWDGNSWESLEGVLDGSAFGGDAFAQDGYVSFHIPHDWALGANAHNAALDADKYYIQIMVTTAPSTDPDADILCPCDDQYYEIPFANMDFSGPIGRVKSDEILVLNRAKMDLYAHYIEGSDDRLFEAMPLSFSCLLDDIYNRDNLEDALFCDNPGTTYWIATGTSTKGSSKNDGVNYNPQFIDTTKKTVNVHMLWEAHRTGGIDVGYAFYEVLFDRKDITFKEDDNGVTMTCNGICFGDIEEVHDFGNRY